MPTYLKINDAFSVSPQLTESDVAAAAGDGYRVIVNNRPDGEAPNQPSAAAIAAVAQDSGLQFVEILIGPGGVGEAEVEALAQTIDAADGPVLAYCASGARSAFLWAFAAVRHGADVDETLSAALQAGFDLRGYRSAIASVARADAAKSE